MRRSGPREGRIVAGAESVPTIRRDWTRDELLLAMNLYCRTPYGRLHKTNPDVVALAEAIGRTPSSVAMKLVNLSSLDPAQQNRGIKGLKNASRGDRAVWDEFHADWEGLAEESESLRNRLGLAGRDASDSDDPVRFDGATEVQRPAKVRLAQGFFRRSVLSSYESRCCVTDIAVPSLLVASHILPWSTHADRRADPRNGLCLSRLHDAAFDRGLIAFDDEFRMVLSRELREATSNRVLCESFVPFEGRPLRLPDRFRPDPEFLAVHAREIFRG